jgi:transposase
MRPKPFTPTRIFAGASSGSAAARAGAARTGAADLRVVHVAEVATARGVGGEENGERRKKVAKRKRVAAFSARHCL